MEGAGAVEGLGVLGEDEGEACSGELATVLEGAGACSGELSTLAEEGLVAGVD